MSAHDREHAEPRGDNPPSRRKRLETELARSEERFRRIFEQSNDALFLLDPRSDAILDANPRASEMLGYPHAELLETPISAIHPDEMPRLRRFVDAVVEQGHGWTNELSCVTRSGDRLPAEISASVTTFDGELCVLASVRDISQRKLADDALRASEARYRQMYDHTPVMMHSIDDRRRMVSVNQFWLDALGYQRDEVLGRLGTDFLTEASRRYALEVGIPRLWETGSIDDVELQMVRKNGELIDVLLSAVTVPDPKTGRRYSLAFIVDVTERNRLRKVELEKVYLQEELDAVRGFGEIVGEAESMQRIFEAIQTVAPTDATVLILGETGTGKELVARAIHRSSHQSEKSLVRVNCAALPATLVESELFGHEKGAFTGALTRRLGRFELADGGTILLDEIGDLPLELQSKLLRVLQDGEFERVGGTSTQRVEVRVVAATNRNLEKALRQGRFRSDLFYRLNVFPIELPPLRERRDDIPLLARHFVMRYASKLAKQVEKIPRPTMDTLLTYPWPGNVRELENVIERGVIIARGPRLEPGQWLPHLPENRPSPVAPEAPATAMLTLDELQRRHILEALERTGWLVSGQRGAARLLGLKPTTLEARMKKLGIERS